MSSFSPEFILQLIVSIGSVGALYGAIRTDLNNMRSGLAKEIELREAHEKDDDTSFHDIRGDLQRYEGRIAKIEGKLE